MKALIVLLAAMLLPMSVKADTLRLTDNSTWNGIVTYSGGKFYITGRYRDTSGKEIQRTYSLKGSVVVSLRINGNDYNQDAPSPSITNPNSSSSPNPHVVINIANSPSKCGTLISIDEGAITLENGDHISRSQEPFIKVGDCQ
jgi:hypothetical protein